ncbi:hypothetical protein LIER_39900 [Lithospermum erythrorhizon]|uniref:Uncharacterized protein n=1 Tax=Lithospermum erythrorhizon TaxID=34254 RepID=A0AAV3QP94_LITER
MGGPNDKGKKKAIEKPKKPKRRLLIPVPRMNAPLVIREPDSVNSLISKVPSGFSKSKARTFSGRNPTVPIQQPEEDSESDALNESDEMNNTELVEEGIMNGDDFINDEDEEYGYESISPAEDENDEFDDDEEYYI